MGKSKACVASEARGWRLLSEHHAPNFMPCLSFSSPHQSRAAEEQELLSVTWGLIGPLIPYQICAHFSSSELTEWPCNVIESKHSVKVWHIADLWKSHPSLSNGFYVCGQWGMYWSHHCRKDVTVTRYERKSIKWPINEKNNRCKGEGNLKPNHTVQSNKGFHEKDKGQRVSHH